MHSQKFPEICHQKEGRKQKLRRRAIQKQVMQDEKEARESRAATHQRPQSRREGRRQGQAGGSAELAGSRGN